MEWKPKVGEKVWYITFSQHTCGWKVRQFTPHYVFSLGYNMFRTKKEATAALKRVKLALKGEG